MSSCTQLLMLYQLYKYVWMWHVVYCCLMNWLAVALWAVLIGQSRDLTCWWSVIICYLEQCISITRYIVVSLWRSHYESVEMLLRHNDMLRWLSFTVCCWWVEPSLAVYVWLTVRTLGCGANVRDVLNCLCGRVVIVNATKNGHSWVISNSKPHIAESLKKLSCGVKCECDWLLSHYSRFVLQDSYHTVHTWLSHICYAKCI